MTRLKRSRLLITLAIAAFLFAGTAVAIYFAKGYRPNLQGGTIEGTGLLSATSYPNSAQVYINDKLTTATDDTINLLPGTYKVRIVEEGFLPWEKELIIQKELVSATNARLFPSVPSLSAFTVSGASLATPSPDLRKVAYLVTNSSKQDNTGVYVYDANSALPFVKNPARIADLPQVPPDNQIILTWSPDSKSLLLLIANPSKNIITHSYLLKTDTFSNLSIIPDSTIRLPLIFSDWEEQLAKIQQDNLSLIPPALLQTLYEVAVNVHVSPDKEKLLYSVVKDVTLADNYKPSVASPNPTKQTRSLKAGSTYIYDTKEDTNYLLSTFNLKSTPLVPLLSPQPTTAPTPISTTAANNARPLYNTLQKDSTPLQTLTVFLNATSPLATNNPIWYSDSSHLIYTSGNQIALTEYDGTNHSVVYTGPFDPQFILSSPTGNKLYLLTNLGQGGASPNIYTLDLK